MKDQNKNKTQLIAELEEMRVRVSQLEKTESKLKHSEKNIHLSEKRGWDWIDQSPVSIQILDENGMTIQVNKAWEELWGMTWEEFPKLEYNILKDEQLRNLGIMHFVEAAFSGESVSVPATEYNSQDITVGKGNKRWVKANFYPIINESGKPQNVILMHKDITDQKQAEDTLQENENLLRKIAENYPNSFISVIEKDFTIGFSSGQEFKNRNLDPKKFIGLSLKKVFGDKANILKEEYTKTFKGKENSFELLINDQYYLYRTVPLFAEDGTIPRILAVVENITERKHAEEKITNERIFTDTIIQSMPGLFYIFEASSARFVRRNANWVEVTGYSNDELDNMTAMDLLSNRDLCVQRMQEVYDSGSSIMENPILTKSGKLIPYFFTGERLIIDKKMYLAGLGIDITERKEAEDELRKLASVVQYSSELVNLATLEGNMIFLNEAGGRMLGIDPQKIEGVNIMEVIPEHLVELVESELLPTLMNGDIWEGDLQYKNLQTGNVTDVHAIAFTVVDPSTEEPLFLANVSLDINDRKQVEAALILERNRGKNILEGTNAGTWDWNIQTGEVIFNERWAEILGRTLQELEPSDIQTWISNVHPDDLAFVNEQLEKHFAGKRDYYDVEFRQPHKNGNWIWVNARGKVVEWTEGGKPLRMSGTHLDITERKLAEEALRENDAKYRYLIEDSGDAIYLLYNRRFEIINTKFTELFGITIEQANSPEFDFINLVAPESRPFIEERIRLQTEGKELDPKYEFSALNHKGQTILVEATVTYIKYKQGFAAQGIIRDVSEKRKLQQQLQQAQKMEAIGTLAGGIAHDFNNLLTVINGYAEIALLEIDKNNNLYRIIESISEAGNKAVNLTSQLLAYSRKQIYNAEIVEINSIIQDMDKMLRRLIGEDINIDMVLCENLFKIKGDKSQIEQIFINLIINARDAVTAVLIPEFKKKIIIETGNIVLDKEFISKHSGSLEGPHIFFSVSDNGIGIDEEIKNKIFEPFFTTKEKFKGTGLGMSTVYGIVKQNNGSIYIDSEPGCGATFIVYWPVTEEKMTYRSNDELESQDFSGDESVLLVEDDSEVCRFAKETLVSLGYNVCEASNGLEAFELVKKESHKYDIIVTDLIMPELNGKEFVEKVMKINSDIEVIYVSGYTDNYIVQNGMLKKGVNFIHKPYSTKDLAGKVRQVLNDKIIA